MLGYLILLFIVGNFVFLLWIMSKDPFGWEEPMTRFLSRKR